jgi:hypothetical protein
VEGARRSFFSVAVADAADVGRDGGRWRRPHRRRERGTKRTCARGERKMKEREGGSRAGFSLDRMGLLGRSN